MSSPTDSDRPRSAHDATVVRNPDQPAETPPASATTDVNRTVTVPAPVHAPADPPPPPLPCGPGNYDITASFQISRFVPPAAFGSTAAASGQAIRNLNDWIEHNRECIDVGDYKLLRSIGTGAFGTVWEAHNFETGEHVAIKFLSAGDLKWEAMLAEVKFLQAMEGAGGIVSVKQVRRGNDTQPPYYVMPKANGGSLADWIQSIRTDAAGEPGAGSAKSSAKTPAPIGEYVRIFTRVTAALAAVHRRGIHHCDLKPRNILLHAVHDGDRPDPLIADFGQAHLATDDTPALGTFFYMPPDQAEAALRRGEAAAVLQEAQAADAGVPLQRSGSDSSWDVYALGAVLYEMLTGVPPRKSDDVLKEIQATHHLDSKLIAYRDGVKSAPTPTEHRKLVDPVLAGIIDRCLSLDPAERPRDAGEVAALLKHRRWWQHFKPVLMRAGLITVALVALIALLSFFVSEWMYSRTKAEVSQEIQGSLAQSAWYGKQVVEDRLQSNVYFAEMAANSPRAPRAELMAAAKRYPPGADFGVDDLPDRAPFDEWLGELHLQLKQRWKEQTPTLTVVVVRDDPGHGFIISRIHSDGRMRDDDDPDADKLFTTSFAFRDYYNGTGDKPDRAGRYSPIRATHISQTYQSIVGTRPWMMEVATPIWSEGQPGQGRVIGLLRLGINVKSDLVEQLYVPEAHLPADSPIAHALEVVLVDDRDHWVWHRKGMEFLARAETRQNPHNYRSLVREQGDTEENGLKRHYPWAATSEQYWQGEYVDPIEKVAADDSSPEFAHATRLRPYARSRYSDRAREWTFVVQVDEDKALRPLAELRVNMILAGAILVVALAALAIVLWMWLFRLLRGWEFAAHG